MLTQLPSCYVGKRDHFFQVCTTPMQWCALIRIIHALCQCVYGDGVYL